MFTGILIPLLISRFENNFKIDLSFPKKMVEG